MVDNVQPSLVQKGRDAVASVAAEIINVYCRIS
nr:hypothetical protein [Mucilaginibacter sp. E4BP6]